MVECATARALFTGVSFVHETRCYARFLGFVLQVVLDPAIFHLGDFLPRFTVQPLCLLRVLLDTLGIANDQLTDILSYAVVNGRPGCLVKHIPQLAVGL